MICANAWPIDASGGDLSCYCAIIRLVKDWNEIVGSVMDWQIGDELVDWPRCWIVILARIEITLGV